jgi:hypothetical protein
MRKVLNWGLLILACLFAAYSLNAQQLRVPETVPAGTAFSIATNGSGSATFYLVGPGYSKKHEVRLGEDIQIKAEEIRVAGRYSAILKTSGSNSSANFFVTAARPANVSFLAHPSRVPVGRKNGIIGVTFVFDKYHNLVREPETVNFKLTLKDAPPVARSVRSKDGVAWTLMESGTRSGNAWFLASLDAIEEKRVIQQVAADPCNLRITASRNAKGILIETEPVRDCKGNPVSDGTVVTFTATGPSGRSTVDAPIKKGVARAQLSVNGPATVSVASGVVMGNEVRVGGGE